jgi:hypothetical protein
MVEGAGYADCQPLPRAFTSKLELLVNEQKKFRRRSGRANGFLILSVYRRIVRRHQKNNSQRKTKDSHAEYLPGVEHAQVCRDPNQKDTRLSEGSFSVEPSRRAKFLFDAK